MPRESASPVRISSLRRLAALARPEAGALLAGTVSLAVGTGATLLYPQAIRLVIDGALGRGGRILGSGSGLLDRAALQASVTVRCAFCSFESTCTTPGRAATADGCRVA